MKFFLNIKKYPLHAIIKKRNPAFLKKKKRKKTIVHFTIFHEPESAYYYVL